MLCYRSIARKFISLWLMCVRSISGGCPGGRDNPGRCQWLRQVCWPVSGSPALHTDPSKSSSQLTWRFLVELLSLWHFSFEHLDLDLGTYQLTTVYSSLEDRPRCHVNLMILLARNINMAWGAIQTTVCRSDINASIPNLSHHQIFSNICPLAGGILPRYEEEIWSQF